MLSITHDVHVSLYRALLISDTINAPIDVKPLGGRPGKGGEFESSHRPVVGTFDRLMAFLVTFY